MDLAVLAALWESVVLEQQSPAFVVLLFGPQRQRKWRQRLLRRGHPYYRRN
jgi:hypothetical protein